ncbi:hypothetical protein D4S03_03240 [bacterium]|nr:MAG: hypothetical protein D4S03_03240 [bacterium]
MKTIVSIQDISEFDIKPNAEVNQWRGLVEEEINHRWKNRSGWIPILCPACSQNDPIPAFERYGVSYVECSACGSLYAPFRPAEGELWTWYRDSKPAQFWRETILTASDMARLEKITRPRADWILDGIAEYNPSASHVIDISPHSRALLDLLAKEDTKLLQIIAAGFTADLEGFATDRVKIQPSLTMDLPTQGPADVVIAIDSFNRASDPYILLEALEKILVPGGLVFATATVASGFEIQSLWEKSPSIIPPDKLNLPTIDGFKKYFTEPIWEIIELSTPGMFDVELVYRSIQAEPNELWPRVIRGLVQHADTAGRTSLVELLQSQHLTSFARLVIKKKK